MPAPRPAHGKEAGMGFFDTVKGKAGALAADAERAGKVTAAQARLVVLQNDLKKAERELGHAAYALAERGELDHPDLTHAIERLRGTSAEVRAKEAEIAALRGEAAPAETTTAAGVATAPAAQTRRAEPPQRAAAAPTTVETASGPVTVDPVGGHGRRGRGGRDRGRGRGPGGSRAPRAGRRDAGAVRQEAGPEARGAQDRSQGGACRQEGSGRQARRQGHAEEDRPQGRRHPQEVDAADVGRAAPGGQEAPGRLLSGPGGGRTT